MAPILQENALPRRKLLGIRPSEMERHQTEPVPGTSIQQSEGLHFEREQQKKSGQLAIF